MFFKKTILKKNTYLSGKNVLNKKNRKMYILKISRLNTLKN